jgi:uncharacterized protein (TIGR03086 family)
MDLLDLFERGTAWTSTKLAGAADQLDAPTPCDEWTVRRLIDHMLDAQRMFAAGASGGTVAPPTGPPPKLVGEDPAGQYEDARKATLHAYSQPGVLDGMVKGGTMGDVPAMMILGIAFCDQLTHGWDLAKATGQDVTISEDLAATAFALINGRITDDARGPGKNFKAAVPVPDDASVQEKLIGYLGRDPR